MRRKIIGIVLLAVVGILGFVAGRESGEIMKLEADIHDEIKMIELVECTHEKEINEVKEACIFKGIWSEETVRVLYEAESVSIQDTPEALLQYLITDVFSFEEGKILDVEIRENTGYIDMDSELNLKICKSGTEGQESILKSMVATLTLNYSDIENIMFKIDGQETDMFGYGRMVEKPLKAIYSIVLKGESF